MAKIGLKYLVAAKLNEDGTTYAKGFVVAKAIKANITANSNDVKLYADDGVSESDKSFKDGNISLNVDDLTQKVCLVMSIKQQTARETSRRPLLHQRMILHRIMVSDSMDA